MSVVPRRSCARRRALPLAVTLLAALAPAVLAQPATSASTGSSAAARALRDSAERLAVLEVEARYAAPPAPIAEFFRRDASFATLDLPAPDGRRFAVPSWTQLSTLALMSRPTYRLAELEIRPATDRLWHLDTYGVNGLRIYDLSSREYRTVPLPANTFVSDMTWSPDGARLAFLAHLPAGTEVWTADAATGRAERVSDARVLATLGTEAHVDIAPGVEHRPSRMLQWTPENTLLTLVVPADRRAEPPRDPVPDGPTVRLSRPTATPGRTLPNLLRDDHDAALFEHYTRAQLVELAPGRAPRPLGAPMMYERIALSADGRHVLATVVERPFSLITSWRGFPTRTLVLDRTGAEVATLARAPLREASGGDAGGLRGLAWHPAGGLTYMTRSGGTDRVLRLAAPFDTAAATVVATSDDPLRAAVFSKDGRHLFGTATRAGRSALLHWTVGDSAAARRTLVGFHHPDSLFALPGELWTVRTPNGIEHALVSSAGDAVYLRGEGLAHDFRPRPFVDRVALADTARTRLFQGARDTWDRPLVALDADLARMIVSREGKALFPDSHLWTRAGGTLANLTRNVNPFPELARAERRDFSFTRQDGLEVHGRVSLPTNYRTGQKVPAIFWTYPREYTTADGYARAAVRARNVNAFTHLTWLRWSELWLTQGYALVHPDIPIVGENYNDTYVSNLVDAMYGAMRAVDRLGVVDMDRIGHGGHSYGAFATANLLAHTPFFRAGIAGDGAYNRSLTPFGFQAEPRDMWSAPDTYLEMSPFFKVDQINAPILLYHGADDNNSGTWPMQSERFMQALTSKGKTAALYVYPYESHTPRALENTLDLWARWIDWFDRYVKPAPTRAAAATTSEGGALSVSRARRPRGPRRRPARRRRRRASRSRRRPARAGSRRRARPSAARRATRRPRPTASPTRRSRAARRTATRA